uniref:PHD-type domain-containing protein n=1 Tax=Amphimedon queenslandica TaxID=400682 RepID=A0A1X7SDA4_AMPQE
SSITLNYRSVQQQIASSDCGLFALAFATSISAGNSPSKINYIQNQFRAHLIKCLENGHIDKFPCYKKKRNDSGITKTVTIKVYCLCRQPQDEGKMVQCDECKEWYHEECITVPSNIWNTNIKWKCCKCTI